MEQDENDKSRSTNNIIEFEKQESSLQRSEWWLCQYTVSTMGFFCATIMYGMRVNLSVAIVAMVSNNQTFGNGSIEEQELACPLPANTTTQETASNNGEFAWDSREQGLVLGSLYWGYILTNVIGGVASERYGGRLVLGIAVLLCGILSIASPFAAMHSSALFMAVRFVEGLLLGVSFPAMNSVLSAWALPEERSRFSGIMYAGVQFGTVFALSISGLLCNSTILGGWPSAFYFFGLLGIIWSVAWFILVRDNPVNHPRISQQELEKLRPLTLVKTEKSLSVPWKSIFTSKPMWGTILCQLGINWGFYTFIALLPTYFSQILHFNLSSNGFLSSLPYALTWIFSLIYTNLMTYLSKNGKLSLVNVRRISMAISGYLPMLAMISMCFVGCNHVMAVVIMCTVATMGACYAGFMCSHMDLAPRYAGTLYGITNTVGTIPGFLSPYIAGVITEDNQTVRAWGYIFGLAAFLYAFNITVYLLTITADVQPWNFYGSDLKVITGEDKVKDEKQEVEQKF